MRELRVLFISRKHPPAVGGMERLSLYLVQNVSRMPDVRSQSIVWGHGQRLLPLFAVLAVIRGIWACLPGIDVIHIGDPVLSWLGLLLKRLFRVPIAITVHGLDLTFSLPLYQTLVPKWVKRYDKIICISQFAYEISLGRGMPVERCVIIRPGVEVPNVTNTKSESRQILAQSVDRNWSGAKLLLTVGRLVPRKGVFFFIDQVLPQLAASDSSFVYVVVGRGPDHDRIQQAVKVHGLQEQVCLVGYLPPDLLLHAYNACDLFLAPNVPQPHDVEGFGLVILEAAAVGCPVLVSDIEGLRDTISADSGGWFVPVGRPDTWFQQINALFKEPDYLVAAGLMARSYVAAQCTWSLMAEKYVDEFRRLSGNDRT